MIDRTRSSFQLRPAKDGGYRLIYRYPWTNPQVRNHPGMREALMQWYTRPGTQTVQHADGTLEPPGSITIGTFSDHGFLPSRQWIAALDLDSVRDRIMDDMLALYGPGGEYEAPPGK